MQISQRLVRWSPGVLAALAGASSAWAGVFPANLGLDSLDAGHGMRITGSRTGEYAGRSVGVADINGDGTPDLLIGADGMKPNGISTAGGAYVVFGGPALANAGSFDLGTINGSNGFALHAPDQVSQCGWSISSAGDVNGDGVEDIVVGAPLDDPGGVIDSGASYVVFGRDTASQGNFSASVDLGALDGSDGFILAGLTTGDESGRAVSSAGDLNADGIDDLVIGVAHADAGGLPTAGQAYVVFGSATLGAGGALDLSGLDGTNGFVLDGVQDQARTGSDVACSGDVNNDGIADLIVGARGTGSVRAYVVFGGVGIGSTGAFDLTALDGSNGFTIQGANTHGEFGFAVAGAGDVNGDGVADMVIGAPYEGSGERGYAYVVFGRDTATEGAFPATLNASSLYGSNGFSVIGIGVYDRSGQAVAGAGDLNGDGVDDVVIGAPAARPDGQIGAGQSYVVFGRNTAIDGDFPAAMVASALDADNGFAISGVFQGDASGCALAPAGDVNADGLDDLLVGAFWVTPSSQNHNHAGATYVVFGRQPCPIDLDGDGSTTVFDFTVFSDHFGQSVTPGSDGDLDGNGVVNVLDFAMFVSGFGCTP